MTPEALLSALGFEKYLEAFRANAIDDSMVETLSDQDLAQIGVKESSERSRILWGIREAPALMTWLSSLGLEQYLSNFLSNGIDFETTKSLSSEDLLEVGVVPLGHRKMLLDAIGTRSEPHGVENSELPNAVEAPADNSGTVREDKGVMLTALFLLWKRAPWIVALSAILFLFGITLAWEGVAGYRTSLEWDPNSCHDYQIHKFMRQTGQSYDFAEKLLCRDATAGDRVGRFLLGLVLVLIPTGLFWWFRQRVLQLSNAPQT